MVQSCMSDCSGKKQHDDLHVGFEAQEDGLNDDAETFDWIQTSSLSIVVVGASGDLAKKKTYPSLMNLYAEQLLPDDTVIYGYARSDLTDEELHDRLRPFLEQDDHPKAKIDSFLKLCHYQSGESYGDQDAFTKLQKKIQDKEDSFTKSSKKNRFFYFAIPPNAFGETAVAIKETCLQKEEKGWSRLVVEKPFGRDLESFEELNDTMSVFDEKMLYRIDHYLGVSN